MGFQPNENLTSRLFPVVAPHKFINASLPQQKSSCQGVEFHFVLCQGYRIIRFTLDPVAAARA